MSPLVWLFAALPLALSASVLLWRTRAAGAAKPPRVDENSQAAACHIVRKRAVRLVALALLPAVVWVLLALGASTALAAKHSYGASRSALKLSLLEGAFPRLSAYTEAGLLLEGGDFMAAAEAFETLGGYRDCRELEAESRCLGALELLESDCAAGLAALEELAAQRDERARALLPEANYRLGLSLADKGDWLAACAAFERADGFPEAEGQLEAARGFAYAECCRLYYSDGHGLLQRLLESFSALEGYERADDYAYLCSIKLEGPSNGDYDRLLSLLDFADAGRVIVDFNDTATRFMLGSWAGEGVYLSLAEDGGLFTDLPRRGEGGCYIDKGRLCAVDSPEDYNRQDHTADFRVRALAADTISLYCYENGRSYRLERLV